MIAFYPEKYKRNLSAKSLYLLYSCAYVYQRSSPHGKSPRISPQKILATPMAGPNNLEQKDRYVRVWRTTKSLPETIAGNQSLVPRSIKEEKHRVNDMEKTTGPSWKENGR